MIYEINFTVEMCAGCSSALDETHESITRYRRTKSLRTVEVLPGHPKVESTIRYLGIKVEDALKMAEQKKIYLKIALRSG